MMTIPECPEDSLNSIGNEVNFQFSGLSVNKLIGLKPILDPRSLTKRFFQLNFERDCGTDNKCIDHLKLSFNFSGENSERVTKDSFHSEEISVKFAVNIQVKKYVFFRSGRRQHPSQKKVVVVRMWYAYQNLTRVVSESGTLSDFGTASPIVSIKSQLVSIGNDSTLLCSATGFYPAGITFSWFRESIRVASPSTGPVQQSSEDGTFSSTSTYQFIPTSQDQNATFSCVVNQNAAEPAIREDFTLRFRSECDNYQVIKLLVKPGLDHTAVQRESDSQPCDDNQHYYCRDGNQTPIAQQCHPFQVLLPA
ncbi:UNVERIFIED_CONTAM: hypothetical protein FKN15_056644 [Acipenser sinensis]